MIDEQDAHTAQPDLKGRRAIVTGGTTGIGRATAVLLASYGVKIFTCARDTAGHRISPTISFVWPKRHREYASSHG